MLDRFFSLAQRMDETPTRFFVRVAVRVFSVVAGLVTFAYITIVLLFPFLFSLPFATAHFIGGFLVILAVLSAGAAALGGMFTLFQIAWRIGAGRSLLIEVVPDVLRIFILFLLATFIGYLFMRGVTLGEIDHLSHRIKEAYRADAEPNGYLVHMALYLTLTITLYWYMLRLIKDLVGKYRALPQRTNGRLQQTGRRP